MISFLKCWANKFDLFWALKYFSNRRQSEAKWKSWRSTKCVRITRRKKHKNRAHKIFTSSWTFIAFQSICLRCVSVAFDIMRRCNRPLNFQGRQRFAHKHLARSHFSIRMMRAMTWTLWLIDVSLPLDECFQLPLFDAESMLSSALPTWANVLNVRSMNLHFSEILSN